MKERESIKLIMQQLILIHSFNAYLYNIVNGLTSYNHLTSPILSNYITRTQSVMNHGIPRIKIIVIS